jgi:hypothetical protein
VPEELDELRRLFSRRLEVNRYRYRAKSRCRRCINDSTDRLRKLKATSAVCSISKQTIRLRDEAEYLATIANGIFTSLEKKSASEHVFDDIDVTKLLNKASESASECQKVSILVTTAAEVAIKLCVVASRQQSLTLSSLTLQVWNNSMQLHWNPYPRVETV